MNKPKVLTGTVPVSYFETKGTFQLTKGVEIELGAQLKVIPSEIDY